MRRSNSSTSLLPALLDDLRLTHGEVRILGTPRRLVAYVENIAPRQPDLEQVVKGPPAERAFDSFGQPTKAAEGFARGKGVAVKRSASPRDGWRAVRDRCGPPGRTASRRSACRGAARTDRLDQV